MAFKIMIVDDSKVFRTYLAEILTAAGYETHCEPNGLSALNALAEVQPDLITADIAMPTMDGYEFCCRLRHTDDFGHIPVILVSSLDPLECREKGFESGAIDFISKPFTPEELEFSVNKVLHPDSRFSGLKVLIAEDSHVIRLMIGQITAELGIAPVLTEDGAEALEYMRNHPGEVDLLLTDHEMPNLTGLELCKISRSENLLDDNAPIIFVSSITDKRNILKAFEYGATDYLTKPFIREELLSRLKVHLNTRFLEIERKLKLNAMEVRFSDRTKELVETQQTAIEIMGALIEYRDRYTGQHILRTQKYVELMANALCTHPKYKDEYDLEWAHDVVAGAPLHDIGKIGIRDEILLKPARLTEDEFEIMKGHSEYGRKVLNYAGSRLGFNNFLQQAEEIAGCHHEKWDGSGYPDGLKGEEIPLSARIMAIADVYDALVSPRVYKKPMSHKKACEIIQEGKGKHFDPLLVELFFELEEQFKAIRKAFPDKGFIA